MLLNEKGNGVKAYYSAKDTQNLPFGSRTPLSCTNRKRWRLGSRKKTCPSGYLEVFGGWEEARSPPGPLIFASKWSQEKSTQQKSKGVSLWEQPRHREGIASFFLPSLPTPQHRSWKRRRDRVGVVWFFFSGNSHVSNSSAKGKMAKTFKVSKSLQSLTGMALSPTPRAPREQTGLSLSQSFTGSCPGDSAAAKQGNKIYGGEGGLCIPKLHFPSGTISAFPDQLWGHT